MGRKCVVASTLLALTTVIAACGGGSAPTQAPAATGAGPTSIPATAAPATSVPATQAAATADPFEFVSGLEGSFSGDWTNTTFGSKGTTAAEVKLDRATTSVMIKLSLGGNVFGNAAPAPEDLTAVITPGQGGTFTSKTFGASTITAALVGGKVVVTITSPDVPSARIKTFTATATLNGPTIDVTYDVTFRDTTPAAHGTATLTRS